MKSTPARDPKQMFISLQSRTRSASPGEESRRESKRVVQERNPGEESERVIQESNPGVEARIGIHERGPGCDKMQYKHKIHTSPCKRKWFILHKANYYYRLRTKKAWRVPVVHGTKPQLPTTESNALEKGQYALWMLLLFKPWRDVIEDILKPVWEEGDTSTEVNAWEKLYTYYVNWQTNVGHIAKKAEQNYGETGEKIIWDTEEYWAIKNYPVLRNYADSLRKHIPPKPLKGHCIEDSESDKEEEEGSAKEHIPDMEEEDDDKDLNDTLNAGEAEENSTFLPCGRAPQDILEFLHNERKGEGNTHEAKYFKHLFYLWEHNIPHLKDEAYVASCGMEDLREIHDYTLGNIIQGSKKNQQS